MVPIAGIDAIAAFYPLKYIGQPLCILKGIKIIIKNIPGNDDQIRRFSLIFPTICSIWAQPIL